MEGDTYKVASELPELCPKVITFPFAPKVLSLFPALTVPAWMVSPPVKVLATAPRVRVPGPCLTRAMLFSFVPAPPMKPR